MKLTHFITICLTTLLLIFNNVYSQTSLIQEPFKPTVNILSLWGYVDPEDPFVKRIEKKCHVIISTDHYYNTSNQLSQRFYLMRDYYDIVIFTNTLYNPIKNAITNTSSKLYLTSSGYLPFIRNKYRQAHYGHNVAYFTLGLTGILYNPKNIQPTSQDNIFSLFKKAKRNITVMLDDPTEANYILNFGTKQTLGKTTHSDQTISLTIENFKKLYQNSNFIITNLPEKIILSPNFAFAYAWSGDAIDMSDNSDGKLKFFAQPNISYAVSDLLATLNNKPTTVCVARYLTGKQYLNHVQRQTFYFSPYGAKNIKNSHFSEIYEKYFPMLKTLPWIESVPATEHQKLLRQWQLIKLELIEQRRQLENENDFTS